MRNHFRVCLGDKTSARELELFAQLMMVFNDTVVNDCDAVNRVRMRVFFARTAVSRPASVARAVQFSM